MSSQWQPKASSSPGVATEAQGSQNTVPPSPASSSIGNDENKESQTREEVQKKVETLQLRKEQLALRKLNLAPNRPDAAHFKKLDATIKKNTAACRKLVKMTSENEASLLKELKGLNLNRYINEIVTAITTAQMRLIDVPVVVKICSFLHQNYVEFITELLPSLKKAFAPASKEPITKRRSILRLLIDLYTYGVYNDPALILSLAESLREDFPKDPSGNLILILSFVKYSLRDIIGIDNVSDITQGVDPKEIFGEEEGDLASLFPGPFCPPEWQNKVKNLVFSIYDKASRYLLDLHKDLRKLEKLNREVEMTKGELSPEAQSNYAQQRQSYEKVYANVSAVAELLQKELPELPKEEHTTRMELTRPQDLFKNEAKESAIWEDEGMRSFYEDLEDLSLIVHPALLGTMITSSEPKTDSSVESTTEPKSVEPGASKESSTALISTSSSTLHETASATPPTTATTIVDAIKDEDGAQMADSFATFVPKLEAMMNPMMVDQAAIDFCYINSKAVRKKLINALFSINRNKLDSIPYYSRLVAILNQYMKDIGTGLVAKLQEEFKQLYEERNQLKIESKIKNIIFLSELVKFKVCPTQVIFDCFKMCLDEFVHHNIDVACTLLECCGRFLYRSPETHVKTNTMVERMMRLKNSKSLEAKQETAIENAYYSCKPPERAAIRVKERLPLEMYIRKLVHQDLTEKNKRAAMDKLRKLDWQKNEVVLKVGKGKFSNLHSIASIVSGLAKYHENFGISIVDALLEEVRMGLEQEDTFNYNQKLVAYVKFLGDLYNYSLIEHHIIFDTLYNLLGITKGIRSYLDDSDEIDAEEATQKKEDPHDLFRIRLVCTLLDTCGCYFKRGTHKERLDRFLLHFQKYVLGKIFWSKDVAFMIDDMFEALRPKMVRYATLEEATKALEDAQRDKPHKAAWGPKMYKVNKTATAADDYDDDEDLDGPDPDADEQENIDDGQAVDAGDGSDDEETVIKPKSLEFIPCNEDDLFAKELESMMMEDRESRKVDPLLQNRSGNAFRLNIPMNFVSSPSAAPKVIKQGDQDVVPFKLLLKQKGAKQPKTVEIAIPNSEKMLANNLIAHQAQQQEEMMEMKRRVLRYDERDRLLEEEEKKRGQSEVFDSSFGVYSPGGRPRVQKEQRPQRGRGYPSYPSFDSSFEVSGGRGSTVASGRGTASGSYSPSTPGGRGGSPGIGRLAPAPAGRGNTPVPGRGFSYGTKKR